MPLWVTILLLLMGAAFVVHGLRRNPAKNPELYFGLSLLLGNVSDVVPNLPPALENLLGFLGVLAVFIAAVFTFAFAEPVKKPE